jgi:hypothetical protein
VTKCKKERLSTLFFNIQQRQYVYYQRLKLIEALI